MDYWKSKVLPKIKKVFERHGTKKAAAAEACKSFDDSKDQINKEFEEKKAELQPKVVEIYEATSVEIKTLVKEPTEAGVKKNSTAVNSFLEELVKIEFPGSKAVSEASSKYGAGLVSGPVFFIFEKVSTFVVTEAKPAEAETEAKPTGAEASSKVDREVVVEEEKKEVVAAEKTDPVTEPEADAPPPPPTEPAPPAAAKEDLPIEPPKP